MEKRILSLFALVALIACGDSPEENLEGTWKVAPETIETMIKSLPPEAKPQARKAASQMSMTFDGGKCTVSMPGMGKKEGSYVVRSTDGNKLTLETELDGKKETLVFELDGDRLSATMDGNAMTFVRSG